jgi:hypothetical protein
MYAKAQADVAPISSKTAPRSQVSSDSVMAVTTRELRHRQVSAGQQIHINQGYTLTL